ncbi:hypothetical protein [Streptomyces sp. cg2]|uniref:hypothetical protein n=1 Tax=Streptomyces sp. cg2 TaxID=3238799 RepID=UPI0034E2D67D
MDPIDLRYGDNSRLGGADITISLTPTQYEAIHDEVENLGGWLHAALWALARLRTHEDTAGHPYISGPNDWHVAINTLDKHLLPRLEGIRDAMIRTHANAGGSLQNLATSMDVSRSTAQYRRDRVLKGKDRPSTWENWATGDLRIDPQDVSDR